MDVKIIKARDIDDLSEIPLREGMDNDTSMMEHKKHPNGKTDKNLLKSLKEF